MAMLPYLVREIVKDVCDPLTQLYDQNFGMSLLNEDLYRPSVVPTLPFLSGYLRPHRHISPYNSGISSIANEKDQFKVNLDVQQFKPEEITVKVVDDFLVVDGKHEEKQDKHGFVSRQFTRRYKLPENVQLDAIQSHLSSDGILSVTAPKKLEQNAAKEITIPVLQTNSPAIKQTLKTGEEKSGGDKMET